MFICQEAAYTTGPSSRLLNGVNFWLDNGYLFGVDYHPYVFINFAVGVFCGIGYGSVESLTGESGVFHPLEKCETYP